jgi:hypothetical protein
VPLFLKILGTGGAAVQTGPAVRWPLPKGGVPGGWTDPVPDPWPCARGWHMHRDVAELLGTPLDRVGPEVYLAEARPGVFVYEAGPYVVAVSARLVRRLSWGGRAGRRFACGCAARALDAAGLDDPRLRQALAVGRRYANGRAGKAELAAAHRQAEQVMDGLGWPSDAHDAAEAVYAASGPDWAEAVHDAAFAARHLGGAAEQARQVDWVTAAFGLTAAETAAFRVPTDVAAA